MARPDWDDYFLALAFTASIRADCERRQVGAVVVDDRRRIRGTGYNGSAPGKPGCETCPRRLSGVAPGSSYDTGSGACVALHAEMNALLYTDLPDRVGATLYITCEPCDGCRRTIAGAMIARVVWPEGEYTQ